MWGTRKSGGERCREMAGDGEGKRCLKGARGNGGQAAGLNPAGARAYVGLLRRLCMMKQPKSERSHERCVKHTTRRHQHEGDRYCLLA